MFIQFIYLRLNQGVRILLILDLTVLTLENKNWNVKETQSLKALHSSIEDLTRY